MRQTQISALEQTWTSKSDMKAKARLTSLGKRPTWPCEACDVRERQGEVERQRRLERLDDVRGCRRLTALGLLQSCL